MAEKQTLKLDFMVKKWQDQKIIFGILIYTLCRFQNYKNPVGRIDTLKLTSLVGLPTNSKHPKYIDHNQIDFLNTTHTVYMQVSTMDGSWLSR